MRCASTRFMLISVGEASASRMTGLVISLNIGRENALSSFMIRLSMVYRSKAIASPSRSWSVAK